MIAQALAAQERALSVKQEQLELTIAEYERLKVQLLNKDSSLEGRQQGAAELQVKTDKQTNKQTDRQTNS